MKNLMIGSLAAVALTGCNLEYGNGNQPPPPCPTGHGWYAASYELAEGVTDDCGFTARRDIVELNRYMDPDGASVFAFAPIGSDFGFAQTSAYGEIVQGTLVSETPDADNFCAVEGIAAVAADASQGTGSMTLTYSDIRYYSTAGVPGTQLTGTLTVSEGSCTAEFVMYALYPWVECNTADYTDFDPNVCPTETALGTPDIYGTQLNPDFVTYCDDGSRGGTGNCLIEQVPSLKTVD